MKRNILIIGASRGIGQKIAEGLADEASVFTFSRANNFDVTKDALPVNDLPDVIDGVIYAPGSINLKPFHLLKMEDFQNDFHLNTLGAVKVLQALYPKLKKSESASVVLFSTVAVQKGINFI